MSHCPSTSLRDAKAGGEFRIAQVKGPACRQLRDMGFCEEMQVKKLSGGRNLRCLICGTRLALSEHLAAQIEVVPA